MNRAPVKLAVTGAAGRMGALILSLARADARFQIVAGLERSGNPSVGQPVPGLQVPVLSSPRQAAQLADVMIDFTAPESTLALAAIAAKEKTALVVGTTGLSSAGVVSLRRYAKKIPIVFSPNMSLGVNVLFRLVEEAAKILAHYDLEIIEAHHNQKKDAPSGTAMKLAEVAARASRRSEKDFVFGRSGAPGARKKKELAVLAVRAGDIVGDHTVLLCGGGERIELIHRAHSRAAFASGALDAAAWVAAKRPGLYSMQDVLGLAGRK